MRKMMIQSNAWIRFIEILLYGKSSMSSQAPLQPKCPAPHPNLILRKHARAWKRNWAIRHCCLIPFLIPFALTSRPAKKNWKAPAERKKLKVFARSLHKMGWCARKQLMVNWAGRGEGNMQQQSRAVRGTCCQRESIRRRLQQR
jgi:hypothetical protein